MKILFMYSDSKTEASSKLQVLVFRWRRRETLVM